MSQVTLRIELPPYSHSFTVDIPTSSTILDLKHAISRACIGEPQIDGQRIIWRGRILGDDEKVADIWKGSEENRVVHLAVRPEAWTSTPPEISRPSTPNSVPASPASPSPSFASTVPPISTPPLHGVPQTFNNTNLYILHKHSKAISVLMNSRTNSVDLPDFWRVYAMAAVERNGLLWPSILDEEFPVVSDAMPTGLVYERVTMNGQSYLSLQNPSGIPNAAQLHALKILTFTFSILSLSSPILAPTPTTTLQGLPIPLNVNQLLQQLGFPQLRVAHIQNPVQNGGGLLPDLRNIPLRPLLGPFVALVIRTMLLVYFVSPARKPVVGVLILAWILYEVGWGQIREVFVGLRHRQPQQQRNPGQGAPVQNALVPQPRANPAPVAAAGQQPIQQQQRQPVVPGLQFVRPRNGAQAQMEAILDSMAYVNLPAEEEALRARFGAPPTDEPSLFHKFYTFVILLLTTLHPAVWNRRRVTLRQREGQIRTEANIREREPTEEAPGGGNGSDSESSARQAAARAERIAQQGRRPKWVRDYIQRVRNGDWVDD